MIVFTGSLSALAADYFFDIALFRRRKVVFSIILYE